MRWESNNPTVKKHIEITVLKKGNERKWIKRKGNKIIKPA